MTLSSTPRELAVQVGPEGIALALGDHGEDATEVLLILPTGERVSVGYNAFYGSIEITPFEAQDGTDKAAPGGPALRPKVCHMTAWVDHFDKQGRYQSALHDAPAAGLPKGEHHRLTSQIHLSVGPYQGDDIEADHG